MYVCMHACMHVYMHVCIQVSATSTPEDGVTQWAAISSQGVSASLCCAPAVVVRNYFLGMHGHQQINNLADLTEYVCNTIVATNDATAEQNTDELSQIADSGEHVNAPRAAGAGNGNWARGDDDGEERATCAICLGKLPCLQDLAFEQRPHALECGHDRPQRVAQTVFLGVPAPGWRRRKPRAVSSVQEYARPQGLLVGFRRLRGHNASATQESSVALDRGGSLGRNQGQATHRRTC